MRISAAVLRGGAEAFAIERLDLEEPRADEVLVRLVSCGMCHSDLLVRELPVEFFPGPAVYGHEGAGVVEAVGRDVTTIAVGDHVVLSFRSCGTCRGCAAERPAYCTRFIELNMFGCRPDGSTSLKDGEGARVSSHFFGQSAFASHSVVPVDSVVVVDPAYDLERLGPLGCSVQTGTGAVMNCLNVQRGEGIVVAGVGAVGLAAVMAARSIGAGTIIAVDRHPHRLELARRYGATETVSAPPEALASSVREITDGGADHALDTTGNAAVLRALFDGLHHLGTLGLCGAGFGDVSFDLGTMLSGRRILTVIEGDAIPQELIPRLADLNARGELPFHELIETFPLEDINRAEKATASGEVIKPVLLMS